MPAWREIQGDRRRCSAKVRRLKPGDVIDGKYLIEVQLGEGGMGRVLAASHMALGSTLAIKLLKSDALRYPEVPRRFMREARAMSRLRGEHVVKVMDVGQLPSGEPYMVMEMLHGCDLSTRIKQGPIDPALAVELIVQACEGLAEAHAIGMVHRDVKPANLFITSRPNGAPLIKLLDFGIATAALGDVDHGLTSTQSVIGSPSYMSPEQLRAARDVDARSDIWSLGVTLYELLSGEQPFVAPTLTALSLQIVGEPHAPLLGIPPELNQVLDRCLAKNREDRYPNVAAFAAALAPLFPNGRTAADMVRGSLSQPVAPTLHGQELTGAEPTVYPSGPVWGSVPGSRSISPARSGSPSRSVRPLTSTTGLVAGESAPLPAGNRRRVWMLVAGACALIGLVAFAAVAGSGGGDPQPAVAPPSPAPIAKPPAPVAITPPPAAQATDPAQPIPSVPAAAPAKPPTPGRLGHKPHPTDGRTPLEPDEYANPHKIAGKPPAVTKPPHVTTQPPHVITQPPVVTQPAARPAPCLPSDPHCGL